MMRRFSKLGESLLELVIAMAIFVLIAIGMVSLTLGSYTGLLRGGNQFQAQTIADQAIESLKAVRENGWNTLTSTPAILSLQNHNWKLLPGGSQLIDNKFTRVITLEKVCRDTSDNIASCPAAYTDINTKKITVSVSWKEANQHLNNIERIIYITNWSSRDWIQNNWSGGTGQTVWSVTNKYNSDDGNLDYSTPGEIKLKNLGGSGNGCSLKFWSFDDPTNYTYDSNKIEVLSGVARLTGNSGGPIDNNTKALWHLDEKSKTIIDSSPNHNDLNKKYGNPGYNKNGKFSTALSFNGADAIYINNKKQTGLKINGPLTLDAWIYKTSAATSPEIIVSKWKGANYWRDYRARSYALIVNSNNKAEFSLSKDGKNITSISASLALPLNVWVHIAGVYDGLKMYIFQNGVLLGDKEYSDGISIKNTKVLIGSADYFDGDRGYFKGKIDEVRISNIARWTSNFISPNAPYGPPQYSSDHPSINPLTTHIANNVDAWSGFSEVATKNGGEIYYQLSDNDGQTWKYWNNSSWVNAGASSYNDASVINKNIRKFATDTQKIMFRAFLNSDGGQEVSLDNVQIDCEKQNTWDFSTTSDYMYNFNQITVENGSAKLLNQGGGGYCSGTTSDCDSFLNSSNCFQEDGCSWGGASSGSTENSDFNSTLSPWTKNYWGDIKPNMNLSSSGGNPGSYAKINFKKDKNKQSAGYFQQAFTVSARPSVAKLNLDWIINKYTTSADFLYLYVFLDSFPGQPTIGDQVWSSGNQLETTSWKKVSNIDVTNKITGQGTYYLKIVADLSYPNNWWSWTKGAYRVGFDNVNLSWEIPDYCIGTATACNSFTASSTCSSQRVCSWTALPNYPTNRPSISPLNSYNGSAINSWSSFSEVATKNGGEIYYQLSDNDGQTWKYWNNSSWINAGASDHNVADIVNNNIFQFSTSTGKINFKAFLSSNGIQQVALDSVRVGWGDNSTSTGYAVSGNFISSAFNTGKKSAAQEIKWDQDNTNCNSCSIRLQTRTAPDNNGLPGNWTSWYGSGGSGTYYTNSQGNILSSNLNGNQWLEYRAEFYGDGISTPILKKVEFNYQ